MNEWLGLSFSFLKDIRWSVLFFRFSVLLKLSRLDPSFAKVSPLTACKHVLKFLCFILNSYLHPLVLPQNSFLTPHWHWNKLILNFLLSATLSISNSVIVVRIVYSLFNKNIGFLRFQLASFGSGPIKLKFDMILVASRYLSASSDFQSSLPPMSKFMVSV